MSKQRDLPERREPTHMLRVEVPLNLKANPAAETWDIEDALAEAVGVVLRLARLGTLGLLCDDPSVTLDSVSGALDEQREDRKPRTVRAVLERLRIDFQREALMLYQEGKDGSEWQEAHRRVVTLLGALDDE